MKKSLSRISSAVFAALCLLSFFSAHKALCQSFEVLSTKVICKEEERFIGWPTIARTADGELLAVFSGDRDSHVCPWGKTQMIRSRDDGETWSAPETINSTPLDDRDAGILVTSKGTIIISWFTSLAFVNERYHHRPPEIVRGWKRHIEKLTPEIREEWLGCWIRRSEDGGRTWSECIEVPANSPHGPTELKDGRLLYVGKKLWAENPELVAMESTDDGRSWSVIGTIPVPAGSKVDYCHELHAVEAADGKIIAMIRFNPPDKEQYFLQQTESLDGGRTWSVPHATEMWGYPPHLLRMKDGRLLVSYGYRLPPLVERACISDDNGATWDTDNVIEFGEAPHKDIGYPATVELEDNSFYTVYYQKEKKGEPNCLMGTHWRLK